MPQYASPGVYIEEQPSAIQPIAGVSTSTAGFIGLKSYQDTEWIIISGPASMNVKQTLAVKNPRVKGLADHAITVRLGRAKADLDSSVTPKIDQAIRFLGRSYAINLPETSTDAKTAQLDQTAQEARLLELMERGERIQAVKLAPRLYGFDTTEAHRFVMRRGGAAIGLAPDGQPNPFPRWPVPSSLMIRKYRVSYQISRNMIHLCVWSLPGLTR